MIRSACLAALVALAATITSLASPSLAVPATETRTGTLSAADKQMEVVYIDGTSDVCSGGQGGTQVHYEVVPWTAKVGGPAEFRLTSTPANMASFIIYEGAFDPLDGETNCVAADNTVDNPGDEKIINLDVVDGQTYRIVVFDDTFGQAGGSFRFSIETPGGLATDPAQGVGKRHVTLPGSFSCDDLEATLRWKRSATKVRSAVVTANRTRVATVPKRKIAPNATTVVRDLPGNTTKLTVTLKLKGGGKATVKRFYTRC